MLLFQLYYEFLQNTVVVEAHNIRFLVINRALKLVLFDRFSKFYADIIKMDKRHKQFKVVTNYKFELY